jgi:signal transduction histidine kinase
MEVAPRHDPMRDILRVHERGIECAQTDDLGDLLADALETVMSTLHSDAGSVHVIDAITKRPCLAVHRGCSSALLALYQVDAPGHALLGMALTSEQPASAADLHLASDWPDPLRRALTQVGVMAIHAVPLIARDGHALGAIVAYHHAPYTPGDAERQWVGLIARHTADFIDSHHTNHALKQTAEREHESRARAEDANRRKDQFLATLSHELRQPLTAGLSAVAVLRISKTADGRDHAINVIDQQLRQLARLIDDLGDAAHISRGTFDVRRERVDLRTVVQQAIDMVSALLVDRGHTITIALGSEPAWVVADTVRMRQVFSNLLQNAATYTPSRGHIAVTVVSEAEVVRVHLRDDGIGIGSETLPLIFDVFERGAQPHGSPSLGIGLAVVRQVVELHGGTVSAHSDGHGRGSEFIVTLPALTSRASSATAPLGN